MLYTHSKPHLIANVEAAPVTSACTFLRRGQWFPRVETDGFLVGKHWLNDLLFETMHKLE